MADMKAGPGWPETPPPWWVDPSENVKALAAEIKASVDAAMKRQDDLRNMSTTHIKEMADLRSRHSRELRKIETARLDAIRLVDVGAVQRAAEVQATQASALAAQVVATADAFRVSLAAALEPIQKDIRDLRDTQSRGAGGKEQVAETREVRAGSTASIGLYITLVFLAVAVLGLILAYAVKK